MSFHRVVLDLYRVNQYLRSRAPHLLSEIRGRTILAALGQGSVVKILYKLSQQLTKNTATPCYGSPRERVNPQRLLASQEAQCFFPSRKSNINSTSTFSLRVGSAGLP